MADMYDNLKTFKSHIPVLFNHRLLKISQIYLIEPGYVVFDRS